MWFERLTGFHPLCEAAVTQKHKAHREQEALNAKCWTTTLGVLGWAQEPCLRRDVGQLEHIVEDSGQAREDLSSIKQVDKHIDHSYPRGNCSRLAKKTWALQPDTLRFESWLSIISYRILGKWLTTPLKIVSWSVKWSHTIYLVRWSGLIMNLKCMVYNKCSLTISYKH